MKLITLVLRTVVNKCIDRHVRNFGSSEKFWSDQEVMYNSKVDLHGTGNRSIIVHYVSKNNTLTFDHNFEAIMVVRGQSPWLGDKRRSPAEAESVVDPP